MRKLMGALSFLAVLLIVFLPICASALELIDNTHVIVSLEGGNEKEVEMGSSVNYLWTLFNSNDTLSYLVNISFTNDNDDLGVNISSQRISLMPRETKEVVLTVDSTEGEVGEVSTVNLTFEASNLTTGRTGEKTVSVVTKVKAPAPAYDVPTVLLGFIAVGAVIFVGFFATLIFERTRVPDLLILVILGLILGPVTAQYFGVELVPRSILDFVMPYFAALALVIILFDGGLNLNFDLVLRKI
ncbi:MAG: cation:proton antiporter, partial [Thermoplasmata archaeon]